MQKRVTPEVAKIRMAALCARSEQCSHDIRTKLYRLVDKPTAESILNFLVSEKFIDDSRYAASMAISKVKYARWGKRKIQVFLQSKRLPAETIHEALDNINQEEYQKALWVSAAVKAKSLDLNDYMARRSLMRHLLGRGFEPDLCVRAIRSIINTPLKDT